MPLVTGHASPITSLALPPVDMSPVQQRHSAVDHAEGPGMQMMATTAEDGVLRIWQMPSQDLDWHQVCAVHDCLSPSCVCL